MIREIANAAISRLGIPGEIFVVSIPKFRYNHHMKIKDIIKKNGLTIRRVSDETGLPYSTVNDIANGIISVSSVGLGKCKAIADVIGITLDEFYDIYNNTIKIADNAFVEVKNHGYYLNYDGSEKYIFKANDVNSSFVREVATWDYEDMVVQKELDRLAEEGLKGNEQIPADEKK